jgi:hypothetical protein
MRIKVVAWNLNQRSAGGNWAELRRDPELADADVFLLCEAIGIPSLPEAHGLTAIGNGSTKGLGCLCPESDGCRRRRYSTAVAFAPASVSGDHRVRRGEPVPGVRPSRPGTWTAARVEIEGIAITAVALYGLNDEPYVDSVRRSLSELAPILDDEEYSRHLVLGGDFNILAGKPPSRRAHPGHEVLEEIKAYGLIDCLASALPQDRYEDPIRRADMDNCRCGLREACTHTRTYYDHRHPDIPYQDDYLFASPGLAAGDRLVTCFAQRVGPGSPSDHAPIVAVFDVPSRLDP